MTNKLSFDVEFTRSEIEAILQDPDASYIVVSGNYTYRPDLGENVWEMNALAEGYDNEKKKRSALPTRGCPRPCP